MVIRCYITLGSEWNDLKNWIPHNESELSGRYSHVLETSARIQKSLKYVKAFEDLVKLNFMSFKHENFNVYVDDMLRRNDKI